MSAAETLATIREQLVSMTPEERAEIEDAAKRISRIVEPLGAVGIFAVALVAATIEQMIDEGKL